jgi:hypothetical protein
MVVYADRVTQKQSAFIQSFFRSKQLTPNRTPKGNMAVETGDGCLEDKTSLWALRNALLEISDFNKMELEENKHFELVRDESYFDMIEEGSI